MLVKILIIFTFFNVCLCASTSLETKTEDGLVELIKSDKYVIVLFSSNEKDVENCQKWEKMLISLREDFVEEISAWVVKVVDSPMLKIYSPGPAPALVFFRHGIPMIYDGPENEDKIFSLFVENKEPIVKELTDSNFEGLTQASTGSTTGDWFVMFYTNDCVDCERLAARWETVAAKIKQRVNVAKVNKHGAGATTARRFGIYDIPEFIFFKQGKMYRYRIPKYDVKSFVSFTKEWYRNAPAEKIPVPQSPFDDFVQMLADFLRENPWIMKLGSIIICVILIVSAASQLRRKQQEAVPKKDK